MNRKKVLLQYLLGEGFHLGQWRSRRSGGGKSLSDQPCAVVDLTSRIKQQKGQYSQRLFYLKGERDALHAIGRFPHLQIETIQFHSQLLTQLLVHSPALILIDSNLSWENPINVIEEIHHTLDVPIVMICEGKIGSSEFIKQAYAAGLYDLLFAPISREDFLETLEVLLKYRDQRSLNR